MWAGCFSFTLCRWPGACSSCCSEGREPMNGSARHSAFDRFISPLALFVGLALAFAGCCIGGWLASRHHLPVLLLGRLFQRLSPTQPSAHGPAARTAKRPFHPGGTPARTPDRDGVR